MDNENQRYIEYFQRQLAPEGSDAFWKGRKVWFEENRVELSEQLHSLSKSDGDRLQTLATSILKHEDQGEYDSFFAKEIFEPLVEIALDICKKNKIELKNPVKFVNSPGLDPSPVALASSAEHLLFAGQGTFSFCNYWSKVFSSAIAEVAELPEEERNSPEAIVQKLLQGNVIMDAARLSLRYAHSGSLVGFGRMAQDDDLTAFRTLLVNAMEIFAIGHEIGHFLAHEDYPETSGIRPGQDAKSHELECDAIGLAISTEYGVRNKNPFAFQLIGPLLLFYALHTCERVKSILVDEEPIRSDSHPTHEERFSHTLNFLSKVGASKDVMEGVHFTLEVALCVGSQVQVIAQKLKTHTNGE